MQLKSDVVSALILVLLKELTALQWAGDCGAPLHLISVTGLPWQGTAIMDL